VQKICLGKEMMQMGQEISQAGWNLDSSYSRLPQKLFAVVKPTPVRSPEMVVINKNLAGHLGLNADFLVKPDGIAVLVGNKMPEGAVTIAQAYAGHHLLRHII
jgi:serine/tyrosine/threonine adenylyltransferase